MPDWWELVPKYFIIDDVDRTTADLYSIWDYAQGWDASVRAAEDRSISEVIARRNNVGSYVDSNFNIDCNPLVQTVCGVYGHNGKDRHGASIRLYNYKECRMLKGKFVQTSFTGGECLKLNNGKLDGSYSYDCRGLNDVVTGTCPIAESKKQLLLEKNLKNLWSKWPKLSQASMLRYSIIQQSGSGTCPLCKEGNNGADKTCSSTESFNMYKFLVKTSTC